MRVGEHTRDVLARLLGYSEERIAPARHCSPQKRVDLPDDRPAVLQRQPLDEYSKCIYTLPVITWDEAKRRANLRKDGFDFVDAEDVSMVHTEDGDHIHVISMRKATNREREIYFESITN